MRMTWVVIGRRTDGTIVVGEHGSAGAATRVGRMNVESGGWLSFRVARLTATYHRGAVRQ
jgi:hypothetical protein